MKVSPEALLVNDNYKPNKFPIFLTGNDETYIKKLEGFIIEKLKESGFENIIKTNNVDFKKNSQFLFGGGVARVLYEAPGIDIKTITNLSNSGDPILLVSKSSNKNRHIKQYFLKSENWCLIECYKLTRSAKEKIIKHFISKNKINLSNDVYWLLLNKLDDNYAFLINELETVSLLGQKINDSKKIEKILFKTSSPEIQNIFFNIFNKNQNLLEIYNASILSISDLYVFLNSVKFYLNIIYESENETAASKMLPKYLFKEKDVFLKIYKSIKPNKKKLINNILYKAEKLIRENTDLYQAIGLRFLLNMKKIILS